MLKVLFDDASGIKERDNQRIRELNEIIAERKEGLAELRALTRERQRELEEQLQAVARVEHEAALLTRGGIIFGPSMFDENGIGLSSHSSLLRGSSISCRPLPERLQSCLRPSVLDVQRSMAGLQMAHGELYITVIGSTQSGKTGFISALQATSEASVPAPLVSSITVTGDSFVNPHLIFMELGQSELNALADIRFFRQQRAIASRVVVILYSGTLTGIHADAARNCLIAGVLCLLVRTKCDELMSRAERDIKADSVHLAGDAAIQELRLRSARVRQSEYYNARRVLYAAYDRLNLAYHCQDPLKLYQINKFSLEKYIKRQERDQFFGDEASLVQDLLSIINQF